MENQTTQIPEGLKALPIFQVIGDSLPKTPEGKKTVAKVVAVVIGVAIAALFIKNIDMINSWLGKFVEFSSILLLLGVLAVVGIVFIARFPQIVSMLDNMAKVKLFGAEKGFVRRNFMNQLSVLLADAKDALKKVRDKITEVVGSKLMLDQKASEKGKLKEQKWETVKRINTEVQQMSKELEDLKKKAETNAALGEKVSAKSREIKEALNTASLRTAEANAASDGEKLYIQCSNQIAKVIEILKDNESAAKIYVGAITSSVQIIQDKVAITTDINKATQNLAEVFNISEGWKFLECMDAANFTISNNIANIRENLQFVEDNRGAIAGTMTAEELNQLTAKLDAGNGMTALNVSQLTDASYELQPDQIADKTLKIF